MTEIFKILFNPLPNGIMTILMGFSLFYWIFQLLVGDGLDFGTDADVHLGDINEIDIDHDVDGDTSTEVNSEPTFWSKCLDYINIGKVPFMVIVTLFKFLGWVVTIISTTVLELGKYGVYSVFILMPVFIVVYVSMHYLTKPLVKMFANLGYRGEEEIEFIGRVGKIKSTIEGDKIGFAEFLIDRDVITLNVKSFNGEKIDFGETVVITDDEAKSKYFYVTKKITLNNF